MGTAALGSARLISSFHKEVVIYATATARVKEFALLVACGQALHLLSGRFTCLWGIMSLSFRWDSFLAEVAKRIPPQQFRAWVEPAQFVELNAQHLVISAATQFSRDWITDHYKTVFETVLKETYGLQLELRIEVAAEDPSVGASDSSAMLTMPSPPLRAQAGEAPAAPAAPSTEPTLFDSHTNFTPPDEKTQYSASVAIDLGDTPSQASAASKTISAPVIRTLGQPLNPKHTFESFVVGASNQFAHAAARAVAEQPAAQYNPLFIYSDAGLGKTHLLHAIGNYVLRLNPKTKICYLSAEKFVNDLIDSIHHGKMSQFREKYRDSYDMLLMDDIQFIAGKDRTQEEFFHTFNALHSSRRQIVVTSDKFPKDIPGLEDRIRTRFEWGLIADIQPPQIETRIAILRAKAERDDIFLPNDVALFLASNIKSNIRELEGALIRLGAQASLTGSEIGLDLVKQLLKNTIKEPSTSISADAIQDAVARHFSIKISDIKGKERSRRVALPRQIAMYLIRKYCDKSYPDIGILLGGKDHSTVLYGVRMITEDIAKDPDIRRHVEEIQNSL
jgi:chromosomal replication initiator protein